MKTFAKKAAITCGVLLTALMCMGIIYIDTVQNYWYVNGGFVKLIVSNQTVQAVMTVDTNTMRVGFNTNNTARSFVVKGQKPATVTGNGTTAATTGAIVLYAGDGGDTAATTSAGSGVGGGLTILAGDGGNAASAVTNATAGAGGVLNLNGGSGGGSVAGVATNDTSAGNGGAVNIAGGNGGAPVTASTNTLGGNGGAVTFTTGAGGTPTAGFTRIGGNGGNGTFTSSSGGNSTRASSGNGGGMTFNAGSSGNVLVTPGNAGTAGSVSFTAGNSGSAVAGGTPSPGGNVNFTAGNGSAGDTNSNGGNIYLAGGSPGSGARPGDTYIGRLAAGTGRGGLVIGISNSAVLTNVMFVRTNLDFPSTLAQTDSDIPVLTITGRTNAIVNIGPPPSALLSGVVWSGFCSNGVVFIRCSVYGALAKDPGIGDFECEIKAYR